MNVSAFINAIPDWLRKFIGYGLSAGIAFVLVILAIGSVPVFRDWLRQWLNVPTRTENQVDVQTASMKAAEYVVQEAMKGEHLRQDTIYNTVESGLIRPGLERLETVESRVARIEQWAGRVDQKVGMQTGLIQDQTDQIGQVKDILQDQDDERDQVLQAIQRTIDELKEQKDEPEPTRVSPKKMKL